MREPRVRFPADACSLDRIAVSTVASHATELGSIPSLGIKLFFEQNEKMLNGIKLLISPGIEPGTFSVLTKCDNRYTTKPCEATYLQGTISVFFALLLTTSPLWFLWHITASAMTILSVQKESLLFFCTCRDFFFFPAWQKSEFALVDYVFNSDVETFIKVLFRDYRNLSVVGRSPNNR